MQYTYPTYVGATREYSEVFFTFQMSPVVEIITFQPITLFHKGKILLHTVYHVGHCALRRINICMAMEIVHVILLDVKFWQPMGYDFSILK